jgi:hypothetical protein
LLLSTFIIIFICPNVKKILTSLYFSFIIIKWPFLLLVTIFILKSIFFWYDHSTSALFWLFFARYIYFPHSLTFNIFVESKMCS